jgi:pyridoxal/pyridoxine/pyridoxamine kinase
VEGAAQRTAEGTGRGLDAAFRAAEWFHGLGVGTVVQTTHTTAEGRLSMVCSSRRRPGADRRFSIEFPRIEGYYTGTGDLAAALWLAWSWRFPEDLAAAGSRVVATMHAVISRTKALQGTTGSELRIIQSKADIENPDAAAFPAVRHPCEGQQEPHQQQQQQQQSQQQQQQQQQQSRQQQAQQGQ